MISILRKIKKTFFKNSSNLPESEDKKDMGSKFMYSEGFFNFKEVPKKDEEQVKEIFQEVFKDVDGFAGKDFFDDEGPENPNNE